ncbi:C4-dicarboxylate transporter DctA, partial [Escherichia coli]|uniref:cation:dicarboxylate symporter family transporter n=1 Tax=Escherichia coli TaxID=562 RepID=UPI000FF6A924
FEVVSTVALIIGLVVVNVVQPGAGMHVDPNTLDTSKIAAYAAAGEKQSMFEFIERVSHVMFNIINVIMKVAPIGAFGAMAFTIGAYGVGSLVQLGQLM